MHAGRPGAASAAPGQPGREILFSDAAREIDRLSHELREARLEAAKKETHLQAALAGARAGRYELDLATGVTTWSPEMERLYGMEPGSFRGDLAEWESCVVPEDLAPAKAKLREAIKQGRNEVPPTFRIRRRDTGELRWIEARGSVVPDPGGGPGLLVGLNVDVTDQVRAGADALAEKGFLTSILEHLPVGVAILSDPGQVYRFANRAYRQLMPGIDPTGKRYDELFPEAWARTRTNHEKVLATGDPHEETDRLLQVRREPGGPLEERWFSWHLHRVPLDDGEARGLLVAVWETTERHLAEEVLRRSGESLRASEERFETAFRSSPVALAITSAADGRILDVNDAYLRILGFSRGEVVGKTTVELGLFDEETRASWLKQIGSQAGPALVTVRRPDGQRRRVLVSAERITENGEPCLLAAVEDVTEKLAAEQAVRDWRERVNAFLDSPVVGIQFGDLHGGITRTNDEFLRMVGYTREEFEAGLVRWDELTAPEFHELDRRHIEEARRNGAAAPYEKQYVRKDGSRVWALVGFVLHGPSKEESLAFILDISARKEAKEALRRANEELEDRVAERTAALEEANRELEAFSYSVSHDLRSPLRAIDGYGQLLEEHASPCLDHEGRRLLGVVRQNAHGMSQLIDDLLDLSRAGRAGMVRKRVAMEPLAREAWEAAIRQEGTPGTELALEALPDIEGDPGLLRQVWLNLLSNAAKFSAKTASPQVEVRASRDGSEVTYSVRDNGAGFDMRHADQLFQPFHRLHRSREFRGTGIGLALVRRIVERHGGRVEAAGEPGAGATFSFTLPENAGKES